MRLLQDIARWHVVLAALAFALTFVTACSGGGSDVAAGPVASATSRYIHSDLTFDEAQQVTPFELVMPSAIPSEFEFDGVSIKEPTGEVPGAGDDLTAIFFFSTGDDDKTLFVLEETSLDVGLEGDRGGEITHLTISGVDVTKKQQGDMGLDGPLVTHRWRTQGATFVLTVEMTSAVTQDEVESMIASMVSA